MASELRVNSLTNRSGLGTITYTDSGLIVSGVGTFANGLTVDGTQTTVKSLKLTGDNYNANWFKTSDKLRFNDNAKATFGTSDDLSIYHGGTASYISHSGTGNLFIHSNTVAIRKQNQQAYFVGVNGTSSLYDQGNVKLTTTNTGVVVTGILTATTFGGIVNVGAGLTLADNVPASFGNSNDLQIVHQSGENHFLLNSGNTFFKGNVVWGVRNSSNQGIIQTVGSTRTVDLYGSSNKVLSTSGIGVTIRNGLYIENAEFNMTTNGSKVLDFETGGTNTVTFRHNPSDSSLSTFMQATHGGSLKLYHDSDGAVKLTTSATGIDVTGSITASSSVYVQGNPAEVRIQHTGNSSYSRLISDSNNALNIYTGGGPALGMTIDQNGHVTVASGSLIAQNSGAGSGTSQLQLQPYGTQGYINFTGSSHLYLRMGSSFAQRFIFRNTGDLELTDGNLMVASGHGIDFSATADSGGTKESELLDDYEEGTFTPTFYYVSGTSNVSYTTQEGRYTKIGRLVSIHIKMSVSNIGSGNNNMRVGGLPFAPVNSGVSYDYFNFSAVVGMNIGSGRVPFAQLEDYGGGGRITMYSYDYSSSSNYSEINSSHLSNGLNFGMTGTYVTS
tara:strand:- start:2200 stop:4041 length:1842 start_codon:yes stop_codon:yes gene_type:complete